MEVGGWTWDERNNFGRVEKQLDFASKVLSGVGDDFRSIGSKAYKGLGTTFPAYAASYLIDVFWLGQKRPSFMTFSRFLHLSAFICALGAAWYAGRLVYLGTGQRETSILAAVALLVTPVWIGYSFFNFKDVPVAAGLIATVYYAALCIETPRSRSISFFFIALLFLGAQKLPALALAVPSCVAVTFAVIQTRSARFLALFAVLSALFLVSLYLITPPSWQEPITFAIDYLKRASLHPDEGCQLAAGECIGRNHNGGAGYSAAKYLSLWYAVQLPVLLQVGLLAAIIIYIAQFRNSNPVKHLTFISLIWPISALVMRDSNLYDGIRHTLFLVPLAVTFVFVSIPGWFWLKWRPLIAAYAVFLLIDTVRLQPYGYVWFNEFARFYANESNYETDHWGFSLKEAADIGKDHRKPDEWVVGKPYHLVAPFVAEPHTRKLKVVPEDENYLLIAYTKNNNKPPARCKMLSQVTRPCVVPKMCEPRG